MQKVPGINRGKVVLYALSTCIWCKKTRELLDKMKVEYSYIYMDELDNEVEAKFKEELEKWNPKCSFPTVVINNKECIVGFDEAAIKQELE
ncbi:glutaredoxin family protein [Candidatus Desantisbacteria bacterium]|nr:glutaredoxin family protein [Candidatus Desantisbacteria bacterium]